MGMWALFAGSFRKNLTDVFGYGAAAVSEITKNAKPRYQKIIAGLPEFEKADRFKMNIVNCAMLCAFVLCMPERPDGSGYEARFSRCGICTLMQELGLYDLTPAMCRLDYTMSEAGGASDFVREYTLASGGPYCDCGYHKKQ